MKNSANQPSTRYDAAEPAAQQGAPGVEEFAHGHALREASHNAAVTPFPARPATTLSAHGAMPEHANQDQGGASFTPMQPRKLLIAAIVIAVLGGLAWFATRDTGAKPPAAAGPAVNSGPIELATVDVSTVEPRILSRVLPLSGSISPYVQATVKSKVGGEVEQLKLREGQDVREGEVIARVDTRNLQAQYDREAAAVEKARADLDLARLNRDKNRTLLEQKFISQNTFEQTESAYAGSVAELKLAEAQARVAQINLEDAVIRAPFSGTIAKRLVQPGEKVSPDSDIVTLVDLKQMVLEAAVPAAEIPSVRVGQKVRFRVSGFGDRRFEGEVQRINPLTTDGSRSISVYIAVPNADTALKGGMFAQGELQLDSTEPVLAVAQRAIREEAGASYVYTLRDDKIVRTPVTLGPRDKGEPFVEVRSGLSVGDRVIVADIGNDKAGATARVNLTEVASAAATEVAAR
jgi:membrane fusion protein, multidrug efflux system